jgi:hypothetical protein
MSCRISRVCSPSKRRGPLRVHRRARETERQVVVQRLAHLGVRQPDPVLAMRELRVGAGHVVRVLHGAGGYASGLQLSHQFLRVLLCRPGGEQSVQRGPLAEALRHGLPALLQCPRRTAHGHYQRAPLHVVHRRDRDPAVLAGRRIHAVRCGPGMVVAAPLLQTAVDGEVQESRPQQRQHGLGLREVDELALPRATPVPQRCKQRKGGMAGIRQVVRIVGAGASRDAIGQPAQVLDARQRGDAAAGAAEVALRPFRALHRHRQVDDVRLDGRAVLRPQPELFHHAGREVVGHDVALRDQLADHP